MYQAIARSMLALTVSFLWVCGVSHEAIADPGAARKGEHVVKRGQYLQWIASRYDVGWEAMLLANEDFLRERYGEVCNRLSQKFRNRQRDRGTRKGGLYYCNDQFNRPYGNTLRPGWRLAVPAATAPAQIDDVVADMKGNRIALVIDDTGSMSDDLEKVGEFYLAALRKYKKQLVGVWLYADGQVRKYEAGGVRFFAEGQLENTFGALSEAAREKPDIIVLVTDEQGDDWRWPLVGRLPPVVAHCLRDRQENLCQDNLQRLAKQTQGRYVPGIK